MTTSFVPPPPSEPLRPLDLAQRKGVGALLTSAWRIWKARPAVFLASSLVVASLPMALFAIANELASRRIEDIPALDPESSVTTFSDADIEALITFGAVFALGMVLVAVVVPAIVTATHARAVVSLASGEDLETGEALRRGLSVFGPVLVATLIWGLASLLGLLLLVVPGVFVMLAGMFGPLLVAISGRRGWSAVRESIRVVRAAGWWRTLGTSIVISLVAVAVTFIPITILGALLSGTDSVALIIAAGVVEGLLQAALMSWSALATTLIYFSWTAGNGEPWQRPPGTQPVEIPGGGGPVPEPGAAWGQAQGGQWQQQSTAPAADGQQPPTAWGQPAPGGPVFLRPGQAPPQTPPPADCPNDDGR